MRRYVVALVLWIAVTVSAAPHPLKPKPTLPVDCTNSDYQPCTGSICISQQVTLYCGDTAWQCENDAQQYQGGNVVCCTGKNLCFTCTRMVNGREQTYSVWQYNGVENRSCVLNP